MDTKTKVCPWWLGYMLLSPLRLTFQDPVKILTKYVNQDMQVLDIGCAMGYFSLPLAKLAGEHGRVVCIDLQERMLQKLVKRAKKAGLERQIETRLCSHNSLLVKDLKDMVDFALAFAVVHEVQDKERLFAEINMVLKPGGNLLIAEPAGHVKEKNFADTVILAENAGFSITTRPVIARCNAVLLQKVAAKIA